MTFTQALAHVLAFGSLGLSGLLFWKIRSRLGLVIWVLKILAVSLAGVLVVAGALGAVLGLLLPAPLAAVAGVAGAALSGLCVWRVMAPHDGFERAFGPGWHERLPAPRRMGARRRLRRMLHSPQLRWERDVAFWTIGESGRPLLCDLWQPPPGVRPTGLALVFLHSSAWHLADKDVWTRPLFRHLAAQGHLVMDVAYRLCPEVDLYGMLGDAKRAIAWMKANGARYGARPERVVVAGGSAGGHLALLAAYTPGHPRLTPGDLQGIDTSVRAVASFYGLTDMRAFYRHIDAVLPDGERLKKLGGGPLPTVAHRLVSVVPGNPFAEQVWKLSSMSNPGIMTNLLGGTPDQVPDTCDLASPITHVGPHCPPTLLIQGEHDLAVPVAATRALGEKLAGAGVPVVTVVLPHTDHIFDLVLPQISPAARAALGDLDRFLALVA